MVVAFSVFAPCYCAYSQKGMQKRSLSDFQIQLYTMYRGRHIFAYLEIIHLLILLNIVLAQTKQKLGFYISKIQKIFFAYVIIYR